MSPKSNSEIIKILNEINKESTRSTYRAGITASNGDHYDLKVFIQGPLHFFLKPSDCTSNKMKFPGTFYTVHISHEKNEKPTHNGLKYFCKSYDNAKRLASKMRDDKGIETKDLTENSKFDFNDDESFRSYGASNSQYGGGPTGDLSDDFINDVLDGNPESYWNID